MIRDLSAWGRDLARRFGDRPAAVSETDSLTFRELDEAADRWAAGFVAKGLSVGAHVGLLAGNGPTWLAVALGVWRAGATLVPISTFVTGRELEETLAHADADALVLASHLGSHDYLESLRTVRPALPRLRTVVVLDATAAAGELSANAFIASKAPASSTAVDPESIACMLYTSGTTGRPKGVMLSHRAILATVVPTARRTGLTSDDTLLSSLPLFWVAGLVIRALPTLEAGCCLILTPLFTPEAVVELLKRHQPTAIHLRPAQIGQILAYPRFDPRACARIRRGGGRVEWYSPPLELSDARFITGYGMTEMAGYVVALDCNDSEAARRSEMGSPLPGVQLRIDAADAQTGIGEICVRGPGLFSGYYRESATGLDSDGFFMTGDLGRINAQGALHFAGRSKDLLRVKGINVSPLEVEGILQSHSGIENAFVVGLPFDGLEQMVVALLVCKPQCTVTETEVADLARENLSHYKRPLHYIFVSRDEIPLGGTSKPQRRALADLATRRLDRR